MSEEKTYHILLAEDDSAMRTLLSRKLQKSSYKVTECLDGWSLVDGIEELVRNKIDKKVDLIISDVRMPGITGLSVLEGLKTLNEKTPVILITAFGSEELHAKAKELGVVTVINKPFELDHFMKVVRETLAKA